MIFEKKFSPATSSLHFIYEGETKKGDFKKENITKRIDKIFDNNYFRNDIIRIVRHLRTIFKDFEEKFIMVETIVNGTLRDVRYSKGVLKQYGNTEKYVFDNNTFNSYYDENGGSFSFSNDNEIKNYGLFQNEFEKFIKDELNYINHLKNDVKPVTLSDEGKAIITVYNLFYKELPDLSEVGIETKFQNMLYILTEYGINFEIDQDDVCFYCYDRYPESMAVSAWLKDVISLTKDVQILDDYRLNKESVEIIIKIRSELENAFKLNNIADISFERFCYAIYCKNYRYRSNIPLKELSEKIKNDYFATFSEQELEYYFELKNNINKKFS